MFLDSNKINTTTNDDFVECIIPELLQLKNKLSQMNSMLPQLDKIQTSLSTFNRNFAFYMQGLMLYSQTVEFPEAPNDATMNILMRPKTPPPSSPNIESEQTLEFDSDIGLETTEPVYQNEPVQEQKPKTIIKSRSNSNIGNNRRKTALNVKKYIDVLPSRYRSMPHKSILETILKELNTNPEGIYLHELMRDVGGGLSKSKWTEYMNVLVKFDVVSKINRKGFLYILNTD
ncbi:hypothetical protein BB559_000589 [Furculomyces boomerangus]|uniref:Uncharacterized protein n=2 Tax=Harpellales TaxID=61421 RepID=A0A2T9Z4Q0_9FUNG|nr:hypothetical protein BB559_000589 [Furculomyces boomerangus]PWA00178.1 hypothetical protein BB558_003761 [Smittium angustum]PWA01552.1 hypothetical protein BB558_002383 [Smittium angustum]